MRIKHGYPNFFAYPYNDPSYDSINILYDMLLYKFLFVGNGNYFLQTKEKNNHYVKGIGMNRLFTNLIRRVGRYPVDLMEDIINQLYSR